MSDNGLTKMKRVGQPAEYFTLNASGTKVIRAEAQTGEVVLSAYASWADRLGWEPVDRKRHLKSDGGGVRIPPHLKGFAADLQAEHEAQIAAEVEATAKAKAELEAENASVRDQLKALTAQLAALKSAEPAPEVGETKEEEGADDAPEPAAAKKQVRKRNR